MDTAPQPSRQEMREPQGADVCIVGAGISGLTTAYLLAREGKSVIVLDDGPLAGGETERTTAHLSNALDDRYYFLEKKHGAEGARLAADSHTQAIGQIEEICRREQIDCDFTRLDGFLFCPPGVGREELDRELEAAHRAGLSDVELVDRAPVPGWDSGPCLRFPGQGQFHPLKYLRALAEKIEQMGGRIYCNTHATGIEGGSPCVVQTSFGTRVSSGAVVVATNSPVNDRVTIHTKQAPYRTYVVGLRVPAGSVPLALYWDTAQDKEEQGQGHNASYHYVRLQRLPEGADELLIVGGEDHKTGQADDMEERWRRLEQWTRERFSMASDVRYRWSGQVLEPVDGMAFIGRNPGDEQDNVYVITGDSGHGMTHGTLGGMLVRDLILGRDNAWAKLYDPSRTAVRSAGDFARENLNVAARYAELVTGGDIHSVQDLSLNSGAVIRKGTSKIAVYRDEHGELHEFSAVCPHLKCIVHWNHAEKSWDCPCHGSRFSRFGEVLNGPAISNLKALSRAEAVGARKG
jgi:glycine/D-amino acid oxidase-like deaminating enzyme/nitrite reductase/ring-hydroxylating ferredoxin subunit